MGNNNNITPDQIKYIVANHFGYTTEIYKTNRRWAHIIKLKHLCMFLLRTNINYLNGIDVAKMFGYTNHCITVHAEKKIMGFIEMDKRFAEDYRKIQDKIEKSKNLEKFTIDMFVIGKSIN